MRLGAALLLVGKIQIFQTLLGFSGLNLGLEFRRQLALLFDRRQDAFTPLLQFPQVDQALFQMTELGVVQSASGLFSITRNKGHGGPFV